MTLAARRFSDRCSHKSIQHMAIIFKTTLEALSLLTYTRDMPGSNLDRDVDFLTGILWSFSFPPSKSHAATLNQATTASLTISSVIHYSFDAVQSELPKASLRKPQHIYHTMRATWPAHNTILIIFGVALYNAIFSSLLLVPNSFVLCNTW